MEAAVTSQKAHQKLAQGVFAALKVDLIMQRQSLKLRPLQMRMLALTPAVSFRVTLQEKMQLKNAMRGRQMAGSIARGHLASGPPEIGSHGRGHHYALLKIRSLGSARIRVSAKNMNACHLVRTLHREQQPHVILLQKKYGQCETGPMGRAVIHHLGRAM